MDEVPCYFDMARDYTLHFVGSKNVDGADTGYRKHRYTVCLAIALDGRMLPPMIIFRGLKKAPQVTIPGGKAIVAASKSGTMDTNLAKFWLDQVFSRRGNYFNTTPSVLIWDSFGTHKKQDILEYLSKKYISKAVLIPPKTTHFLQPLDVAVNAPFKAALKNEWDKWVRESPVEYTRKGYRKRPSYQAIVDMVVNASKGISSDTIQKAFECCGVAANGKEVPVLKMNHLLQNILVNNSGLVSENEINLEPEHDDDGIGAGSGDDELTEKGTSSFEENSDDEDEVEEVTADTDDGYE